MTAAHDSVTLAIAPSTYGFGYVVFERADLVLDWGVKDVRPNRVRDCVLKARTLMHMLHPSVLVVEDVHHVSCRRWPEAKKFIDALVALGKERGLKVVRVPRAELEERFARARAFKKHDVAVVVAKLLPELAQRLPARRRMWESEHYGMAIFEAAALALTHFARGKS